MTTVGGGVVGVVPVGSDVAVPPVGVGMGVADGPEFVGRVWERVSFVDPRGGYEWPRCPFIDLSIHSPIDTSIHCFIDPFTH